MKSSTLPVKRKPTNKGMFRKIYSKITNKRHPAATTADPAMLTGDVPNMNVGRALIVIALLHVVAIAGIFIHKKYYESQTTDTTVTPTVASTPTKQTIIATSQNTGSSTAITSMMDLPKIQANDERHMVLANDTYASVARKWNISEQALRDANNSVNLCSGLVLRVPPREIVALESEEMKALRGNNSDPNGTPAPKAVLLRPALNVEQPPRALPIAPGAAESTGKYVVKKGDTFYSIARKYGVSLGDLMKSNSTISERSLSTGMTLRIPDKN
jgi:LysM repeat protein